MLRRRPLARRAVRTAAVVGTAAVAGGAVARRSSQQAAPAPAEAEPQYVAQAPGPTPVDVEQLKQLAGLKDQGILTEEEFANEKAKILSA
ncbi:MAG: SHOCT domain-containing protein [Acidimicrobiia bacterium]